jgi:hypothetical protein
MSRWSVSVIGALFIVMPFAISLPSKASAGQNMLNGFHSLTQPVAVKSAANYYYQDFVPRGRSRPAACRRPRSRRSS